MFKKKIAKGIKRLDDGTMEVTISFSPFKHGHKLGAERNYNRDAYKAMVENKVSQMHIKNGYALGYYSHSVRSKQNPCTAVEHNNNDEVIYPIAKTIEMYWDNDRQEVVHTQRILNNKGGKEIQKLIENGVGGFSSVHNLKTSLFCGFDYVLSPNFSSNRAVVDNVCKGGVCSLDADDIISDAISDTLSREYNLDDAAIVESLLILEKNTLDYDVSMDMINKYKSFNDEEERLRKEIDDLKDEISVLKDDLNTEKITLDSVSEISRDKEEALQSDNIELKESFEKFKTNMEKMVHDNGFMLDANGEMHPRDFSTVFDNITLRDIKSKAIGVEHKLKLSKGRTGNSIALAMAQTILNKRG